MGDALFFGNFSTFSLIFKVKGNYPRNNTDLNQGIFYISGPDWVILAWTGDELSCI